MYNKRSKDEFSTPTSFIDVDTDSTHPTGTLASLDTPVMLTSPAPETSAPLETVCESTPTPPATTVTTTTTTTTSAAKNTRDSRRARDRMSALITGEGMLVLFLALLVNLGVCILAVFFTNAASWLIHQIWFDVIFAIIPAICLGLFLWKMKEDGFLPLLLMIVLIFSYSPMLFALASFGPQYWLMVFTGLLGVPLFAGLICVIPSYSLPVSLAVIFATCFTVSLMFVFPFLINVTYQDVGLCVIGALVNGIYLGIDLHFRSDDYFAHNQVPEASVAMVFDFILVVGVILLALLMSTGSSNNSRRRGRRRR